MRRLLLGLAHRGIAMGRLQEVQLRDLLSAAWPSWQVRGAASGSKAVRVFFLSPKGPTPLHRAS